MIENIKQMRRRHESEIKKLQKLCEHKNVSGWLDYMWAPGHFAGKVKCCEDCGEIIEHGSGRASKRQTVKPIDLEKITSVKCVCGHTLMCHYYAEGCCDRSGCECKEFKQAPQPVEEGR